MPARFSPDSLRSLKEQKTFRRVYHEVDTRITFASGGLVSDRYRLTPSANHLAPIPWTGGPARAMLSAPPHPGRTDAAPHSLAGPCDCQCRTVCRPVAATVERGKPPV